jgi:hypothetical protein
MSKDTKNKETNIFQKWGYKSYFYMKTWMVIDFNTNYQIPLILTSFSNLPNVCHSLNM